MCFEPIALIHIPITICETVTLAFFLKRFLGKKYNSRRLYLIVYILFLIINSAISIIKLRIVAIFSIASYFSIAFVLYRGTRAQRTFCSSLLTAYFFVSEIITMISLSYAFGYSIGEITLNAITFYTGAFISKAILLIFAFIVSGTRKTKLSPAPYYYYVLLLVITYICAGLSYIDVVLVEQSGSPATILHLLSELAFATLAVLVYFVFEKFQEYADRERYVEIVKQQLIQDERRLRQAESQNLEIRNLKHDLANHLISIRSLSSNQLYEELNDYLDEYIPRATAVITRTFTGEAGVDALISEKIDIAESENIEVTANIAILPQLRISPVHINMILGNALDNAIEACRKIVDGRTRYMTIEMKIEGNSIYILVSNSSPPVRIDEDGLPMTDKENKLRHGLGLNIVKRIVDLYEGVMHYECENGRFQFIAQIKQNMKQ